MKLYCYAMLLRPIGIGCLPPEPYELVERGVRPGGEYPKRTDVPQGDQPYGVVGFGRKLLSDEVEKWDLKYVGQKELVTA